MTPAEAALAARIDRDLAFLAPERSIGEYLIEKGYVTAEGDDEMDFVERIGEDEG